MDNNTNYVTFAISIYQQFMPAAVGIAFGFGMCNLIVSTFLRVAFGGKLRFGAGGGVHG